VRRMLVGGCLAAALAVAVPATAEAFPEYWEVQPPATWTPLPNSTSEALSVTGSMSITGGKSGIAEFKSTCKVTGVERIENQETISGGQLGIDEMHETFGGPCKLNGQPPYPCVSGDTYSLASAGPWSSELVTGYDVFELVSLEVRCSPSGHHALYKPPGGVWPAKLGENALKFPFLATLRFKNGPYFFNLWGTLKLHPLGVYTGIR
jgi:hypothetical protein